MNRSKWRPTTVAVSLMLLGLLFAATVYPAERDEREKPAAPTLFDPDPAHPWNRLHAVFYVRRWHGGGTYIHAGPDAPFGSAGLVLVEGPTHTATLSALDTFLEERHDKLVTDPLKRAVMFRDLWHVFDKLAERPRWQREPDRQRQRREVQKRLAQVMRRLELTADQIGKLPDTYVAAVKAGAYPAAFDPEHPERAFLPADLRPDGAGEWVPVTSGNLRELAAPMHARFVDNKAAFVVLLRLPGGRKATEEYIKAMPSRRERNYRQLPDESQVALVRRMLLPDRAGVLHPTAIVENVRFRVFPGKDEQRSFEFELDRGGLLAGKSPLRSIDLNEGRFFGFSVRGSSVDPLLDFEGAPKPSPTRCVGCHNGEKLFTMGVFGFNLTSGYQGANLADVADQMDRTISLKTRSYSWGLLQGLRETSPP